MHPLFSLLSAPLMLLLLSIGTLNPLLLVSPAPAQSSTDGDDGSSNGSTRLVSAPEDLHTCRYFSDDAPTVTQFITMERSGERIRLIVPRIYFEDAWDWVDGQEHVSQLFRVRMRDFEPITRDRKREMMKLPDNDLLTFLVEDFTPVERLLQIALASAHPRTPSYVEAFSEKPGPYGLTELVPILPKRHFRDVFIKRGDAGEVQSILSCSGPLPGVRVPGCQHYFKTAGFDIRLQYKRTLQDRWRIAERKIGEFLTCARAQAE